MTLTFCANASCPLKEEDLKWASLGRSSIGESKRKVGSREIHGDLSGSEQKGNPTDKVVLLVIYWLKYWSNS